MRRSYLLDLAAEATTADLTIIPQLGLFFYNYFAQCAVTKCLQPQIGMQTKSSEKRWQY